MVANNKKDINSIELQIKLPNSKIFNIKGTHFKYKVHYDQLNDKAILSLEERVNYIFRAYKKRYTLPVDEDVTFKGYIYNNLRDYVDSYPEVQATSPKGSYTAGHAIGLNHYLPYKHEDDIRLLAKYQSTLAHEIAHSLNYYNQQKHGIHIITKGNRTEHDEVYDFGWDVGKEIFFLLKERESGYDGRLSTAVQSGDISKVTDLLNGGTNINAKDNVGKTPLHKATDESIARLLIERGADINVIDNSGKTPFAIALEDKKTQVANFLANVRDRCGKTMLHYATEDNDLNLVGLLIDNGADINARDKVGQTPLHKAADKSISMLLIERGVGIDVVDSAGKTPFEVALKHQRIEVANFLANAKDKYGKTMLHYAAEDNNLKLVRILIDNGADINAKNNLGKTPFAIALEGKKTQVANFLANAKDGRGKTMLHYAAKDNDLNLVGILIERGAGIDVIDNSSKTPFEVALKHQRIEVANFLANVKDKYGKTMLHYAAKGNNLNLVTLLIENGADFNIKDNLGKTPFAIALEDKKTQIANLLANAKDKCGKTMLHYAVEDDDLNLVGLLIDNGADVNAKDNVGQTPLYKAIDQKIAKLLIDRGADINIKDNSDKSPFEVALERIIPFEGGPIQFDLEMLSKYMKIDVVNFFVNAKDRHGKTMLYYAAKDNDLNLVRILIDRGAVIDAIDNSGKTPFEVGLKHQRIEVASFLANAKDKSGKTMLHYAAKDNNLNLVTLLIDNGADFNARDNDDKTPLHHAVGESIARLLIERGADINAKETFYNTPFEIALRHQRIEVARFLANAKDKSGKTMLHYAAEDNHLSLVRILIDNGADVNARDYLGETPLHKSISWNVAKLLTERGANINAKNNLGKTPFEIALEGKKTQVANFLVNAKDKYGKTMLHYAAEDDNLKLIKLLIDNGADINAKDNSGKTPFEIALEHQKIGLARFLANARDKYGKAMLHYAAKDNNLDLVTLLINNGADINAKDNVGQTPLHKADDESIARLLVERGANINVKDNRDKTPFEVAFEGFTLEWGSNINVKDNGDRTPSEIAFKSPTLRIGKIIFKDYNRELARFLANAKDRYGNTILHYAVKDGNLNLVTLLIDEGANIEARGDRNVTPLYCAARDGYLEIARFLLDKGADANARVGIKVTAHTWTPLHTAAAHGNLDVVKLILDKRDDVDAIGALSVVGKFSKKDSSEIRNLLEERIRRNEENMQHLNLIRRKRHQHSQEEGSSLSIGVHNHLVIAKENEDSLQNNEIGHNKIGVTSSATRISSWINDLFGWGKSSISGLLSFKPESTPSPISQIDASMDVNSTIVLLDVLVRKFTGKQYISAVDQSIPLLEARGYALNITRRFEKVVEQAGLKSGMSMRRLNIDYMGMQKEITRKVMSGKFNEISGILNSHLEKACPGREAGCPGKLSEKKFNEFMAKFNKGLDVILNQSTQQILHKRDDTLEVNNIEEQQGPRSYLNNASIQGHLTRNKVKLIS